MEMKKYKHSILMIVVLMSFLSCQDKSLKADLIISNSSIWTGNDAMPRAEAMAISGDTLLAVGNEAEILKFKGKNTRVLDLKGKFVTPGFIDSHLHFVNGGFNLSSVQLRDAGSKEEFVRRIGEYAKT